MHGGGDKALNIKNAVGLAAVMREQKRKRHIMDGHACRGLTIRLAVMRVAVHGQYRAVAINHFRKP